MAVDIGELPTISKLSPKFKSKFVDVLSPIIILLFTSLSFVILPVNCAFSIVPTSEVVGYEFASDKFNAGVASVLEQEIHHQLILNYYLMVNLVFD